MKLSCRNLAEGAAAAVFSAAVVFSAATVQAQPADRIHFNAQDLFLSGGNVAWVNFARDIGPGVTDLGRLEGMFRQLHENGGNTMRLWLHTTGAVTPAFSGNAVVGPGEGAIDDLRDILDLAWRYEVGMQLCLWSFDMLRISNGATITDRAYALLTDPALTQTYIDNALIPMVESLAGHPAIIAWEIFNEAEGMSNEFGWSFNRHVPMSAIQRFVNMTAGAIHRADPDAQVTNGIWSFHALWDGTPGKRAAAPEDADQGLAADPKPIPAPEIEHVRSVLSRKYDYAFSAVEMAAYLEKIQAAVEKNYYSDEELLAAGGDPDGTLDFYNVHYYEWAGTYRSPFHHDARHWNLDKPIVVGEFYLGGGSDGDPDATYGVRWEDLYTTLFDRGYAGAMGWQWYNYPFGAEGVVNWPRILASTQRIWELHREAVDVDRGLNIVYFRADPPEIREGQSSTLSWAVSSSVAVTLDGAAVDPAGVLVVTPAESTTYTLIAGDGRGEADTSSVIVVVRDPGDNRPPTVHLTQPGQGAVVAPGSSVTLKVNASDPDGPIAEVQYFIDGSLVTTSTAAPFDGTWSEVVEGEYEIHAVAIDDGGLSARTLPQPVFVVDTGGFARIEAESAAVTGDVTRHSSVAASGRAYVEMRDSGTITFSGITRDAAGEYLVIFAYNLNFDVPKDQYIYVNGESHGALRFNGEQSAWLQRGMKVPLRSGSNTIEIRKYWGWMSFDYIAVGAEPFTVSIDEPEAPSASFQLHANYPNPFNPETVIAYSVPYPSHVRLAMYDVLGRRVALLVDETRSAGRHEVSFNAFNLPSGPYAYRLETDGGVETRWMMLLR